MKIANLFLAVAVVALPSAAYGIASDSETDADAVKCAELSAASSSELAKSQSAISVFPYFAEQAVAYCTRAIDSAQLAPHALANTLVLRGLWLRQRNLERAIADFDSAIRIDPQLAEAYFRGSRAAISSGPSPISTACSRSIRRKPRPIRYGASPGSRKAS